MKRKITRPLLLIYLLLTACATQIGSTRDQGAVLEKLPREYSGTFRWHGDESVQEVSISIRSASVDENDNIIAIGSGRYVSTRGPTNIEVKIEISWETLRLEMWELDPVDNTEFITSGSHIGRISEDFETITAVWTTEESGEQGELELSVHR